MDEGKMIELIEDVAGLKVSMASIEGKLDDLCHRLLGNGQPGIVAELRQTDTALGERISRGERRTTWLTGVWMGASTVAMIVFAVLKFILHI